VQLDELTGPDAPPRSNGELVFAEPWEARAFGLAVSIVEQRCVSWNEFSSRLVHEIRTDPQRRYYASWLAALERLVFELGLVAEAELDHEIEHVLHEDAHDHPDAH
jgi:nitrile hydratase accessory protein